MLIAESCANQSALRCIAGLSGYTVRTFVA